MRDGVGGCGFFGIWLGFVDFCEFIYWWWFFEVFGYLLVNLEEEG